MSPSVPLRPGTRLGPYEVEQLLGVGGRGEVYAARDPRLGRSVAIKVLPVGTADTMAVVRLRREAHVVAALNHPNICSIFDIGEDDGSPFGFRVGEGGREFRSHHDSRRSSDGSRCDRRNRLVNGTPTASR